MDEGLLSALNIIMSREYQIIDPIFERERDVFD